MPAVVPIDNNRIDKMKEDLKSAGFPTVNKKTYFLTGSDLDMNHVGGFYKFNGFSDYRFVIDPDEDLNVTGFLMSIAHKYEKR
jgi:hypothetical protein